VFFLDPSHRKLNLTFFSWMARWYELYLS
jgi:hypothetical protein